MNFQNQLVNIHAHHLGGQIISELRVLVPSRSEILENKLTHPYLSLGIHPWDVDALTDEDLTRQWMLIEKIASRSEVVVIGETGLDKLYPTSFERQIDWLKKHIDLSERTKKPLILHCVRAHNELMKMARDIKPSMPWILHDYQRGETETKNWIKAHPHIYFSLSPRYFQKPSFDLSYLPLERVFLETDDFELSIQDLYELSALCPRQIMENWQKLMAVTKN